MAQSGLGIAIVDPFTAHYFSRLTNVVIKEFNSVLIYDLSTVMTQPSNPQDFLPIFAQPVLDYWDQINLGFANRK
jgi:hypothetical protein